MNKLILFPQAGRLPPERAIFPAAKAQASHFRPDVRPDARPVSGRQLICRWTVPHSNGKLCCRWTTEDPAADDGASMQSARLPLALRQPRLTGCLRAA